MCNPAEQAGADYANDSKRNNVLVSEMDNLVICANTSASISEGTHKAIDNYSTSTSVDSNEAAGHMSSPSLITADGVGIDHSHNTSEHFVKKVPISEDGQEIVESVDQTREPSNACTAMTTSFPQGSGTVIDHDTSEHFTKTVPVSENDSQEIIEWVDQTREPSKTCIAMATSLPEGDGTVIDGTRTRKTSGDACDSKLVNSEGNEHPSSTEPRKAETKPTETETLLERMSSKTERRQTEEVKFGEGALQETSKEHVGDLIILARSSDGANRQTSIKAVEASCSTSACGGGESTAKAAEEISVEFCKRAETPERLRDMVHANAIIDVNDPLLLEKLGAGSENHSTGPCTETDSIMVSDSALSLDAEEQISVDFGEPLAWIEISPTVAEQTAASSEESASGTMQITMNGEEKENKTAGCSLEIQNTLQHSKQITKDVGIVENADSWMSTTTNGEETENETVGSSLETQNTPQQSKQMTQDVGIVENADSSISTTAMSPEEDVAEHVPRSFKEANGETPSEIEQDGSTASSIQVQATDTMVLKSSNRPELAEFFSNARGSEPEKEIEEQECTPVMAKGPLKKKLFMESPHSLRMLLFSEETAVSTKKDEKHKNGGKSMEFSSKVVPAAESHGDENRMDHSYPAKWYENPDNGEASNTFSGPIAFSGALTYQGVISYSGQIPYSGSISHRSDSSTSTRSFAFPILASDWNSSPVKMGPPDPRFRRSPRRKWYFCFCCRRSSTLFD